MIALTRDLLTLMKKGSRIICTTSVTAYRGSDHLIDYSATKGAIATFIRSLATNIAEKGFSKRRCSRSDLDSSCRKLSTIFNFGKDNPLKRAGQPSEVAPAYVFLASEDSSFITGEIIHINGGDFVGGKIN
jgi:NAD(P)-dependent dehydrogenase (short-subunit alcohol dehydrogenase family)